MGLKFDGVDLKEQFGFVVTKADGRGSPPISSTKLVVPRVDGAVLLNQRMDVRRISISGYVYGRTAAEAAQKKDGLIKLISTAYNSEKKLQFPDTSRYVYVRLAGEPIVIGPVGPVFGAYAYEISLNFEAIDPYFYGDEFNYNDAGFVFSVDADAPIYLISPRREFLEHEPNVTIYPVTIVNLLGKYGDFETDSNGDGLADGWYSDDTESFSLDAGIIGIFSQKNSWVADDNTTLRYLRWDVERSVVGHRYFLTFFLKATTDHPSPGDTSMLWRQVFFFSRRANSNWLNTVMIVADYDNVWHRYVAKLTVDDPDSVALRIEGLYVNHPNLDDGYTYTTWIDGVAVYDLTAMGQLPPPLQDLYGVTNWSDLDKDTLAQLLPFCNGICTLGFTWAGDL